MVRSLSCSVTSLKERHDLFQANPLGVQQYQQMKQKVRGLFELLRSVSRRCREHKFHGLFSQLLC